MSEQIGGPAATPSGQAEAEPYRDQREVNGIKIKVKLDTDLTNMGDYEIYFPQIVIGPEAQGMGISDQVVNTGTEDPEVAKQIFEHACALAQTETSVYEIYKQIQEFAVHLEKED